MKLIISFIVIVSVVSCSHQADNVRLTELAEADQSDRKNNHPNLDKNDEMRLQEAYQLIEANQLKTANDYFNAAVILQHGQSTNDYLKANELAKESVQLNPDLREAKILIGQSQDRYLRSTGKEQWYGTHFQMINDKRYVYPIDTTALTDQERQELGFSSLAELLEKYNKLHQKNETSISAYFITKTMEEEMKPKLTAELVGGSEWIKSQLKYPDEAVKNKISGSVLVQYTVNIDGSLSQLHVVKGLGYGCDEEALRVMNLAKFVNESGKPIEQRRRIPFGQ